MELASLTWIPNAYGLTLAAFLLTVSLNSPSSRADSRRGASLPQLPLPCPRSRLFFPQAGRIADIYSPKLVFIAGFGILGAICLAIPFSPNAECFLVLRAFTGIGCVFTSSYLALVFFFSADVRPRFDCLCRAALSIPSALALIIHLFPDPKEKSVAISMYVFSLRLAASASKEPQLTSRGIFLHLPFSPHQLLCLRCAR